MTEIAISKVICSLIYRTEFYVQVAVVDDKIGREPACTSSEEQSDLLGSRVCCRGTKRVTFSQVHPFLCELACSLLSRWLNSLLVPVYTLGGEWCY